MKDKKLKQAIRAQQAKMGGKYLPARRVLLGSVPAEPPPLPRLEARIADLLPLAVAAFAPKTAGPTTLGALAPRDPELALKQALRHLPIQDLYRTETVMYAGRELGDGAVRGRYFDLHESLRRDDRAITISMMTEKAPLAAYLERGLKLAHRVGITLDQLSPLEAPAKPKESTTPIAEPLGIASQPPQRIEFDRAGFRREANAAWVKGLRHAVGGGELATKTWTNRDEMIEVLRAITAPSSNHMFFPNSGGNDLANAALARESGCIELFCSGGGEHPEILRPSSLTLNAIPSCPSMSYLRLELEALPASGVYARVSNGREELTETTPGHYEDRALWDDGELEPSWRTVTRWLSGSFVVFAKGSLYNSFSDYWNGDTYDGRHNKMSGAQFRAFVDRMVADALARGLPID